MKQERTAIFSFFFFLMLTIASICGAVFTPSSKTAAAMYVVPAIVNNEKIKDIGSGIYDLALEISGISAAVNGGSVVYNRSSEARKGKGHAVRALIAVTLHTTAERMIA
jgi:hypothetical protein